MCDTWFHAVQKPTRFCGGTMSARNRAHTIAAFALLAVGVLLLLLGALTNSGWRFVALFLGGMNLFIGAVMIAAVSVIEGVPWLSHGLSRAAGPVWAGGMIHTEGGRHRVRYDFDSLGRAWFVASDVCQAIATKVPHENALQCDGLPLLMQGENACFSEAGVQAYLIPRAIRNRAANRLLISIRNEVLRKLARQRDQKQLERQVVARIARSIPGEDRP
jgi:hypothetical protein